MKKFLFITIMLIVTVSYSQQKSFFYVEFSDLSHVPTVIDNGNGTITLTSNNSGVNNIYNSYIIYEFEPLSLYTNISSLRRTYSIGCNDIRLMNNLRTNYPLIFIKVEEFTPPKTLYTPNDYSILPPFNGYSFETRYLDRINAKDAWDITHGLSTTIVGINENNMNNQHQELIGKVVNPTTGPGWNWHATGVAGLAAGDTDNSVGLASIGFDCNLAQGSFNTLVANGAKVINMSWGVGFIPFLDPNTNLMVNIPSQTEQDNFNDLSDNQNIVLVAAAGNGVGGNVYAGQLTSNGLAINAENYSNVRHFPASYRNVISVSTVGNWEQPYTTSTNFDNWINMHKVRKSPPDIKYNGTTTFVVEPEIFNQHNDSVDIVVPAYRLPIVGGGVSGYWDSHDLGGWSGTSFSAPIVSGTIGLMFSVNFCLIPKEVESILKLTALNIEDLPENQEFHGRLGGGALDAFKAVQMANEMAKPQGTVNVTDRILYRNWFYLLQTAPFEIKMSNNLVTDEAKIKFLARDNIEILSGDYCPIQGYVDLLIDPGLALNCETPTNRIKNNESFDKSLKDENLVRLYPNPNKGLFTISISKKEVKNLKIELFDLFGKSVYSTISNSVKTEIDISNLSAGVYLVKLSSNELNEILKLIKN